MNKALSRRLSFYTCLMATAVFAVAMSVVYFYASNLLIDRTKQDAQKEIEHAATLICNRLDAAEIAIINSPNPTKEGDRVAIIRDILVHNPDICSSAIALNPEAVRSWRGEDFYMLYAFRDTSGKAILTKEFNNLSEYNYTEMEWFTAPMQLRQDHWSEPYFDKGAGDLLMCTFSHPFMGADSTIAGVLTADISLNEGIASIVRNCDSGDHGKTYLLSPRKQLLFGDTTFVSSNDILFESKLKDTDWVLGHIISRHVLLRPLRAFMTNIMLLFIFTILVIYLSISYTIRRISKPDIQKQMKLDAEFNVARMVQQGMLPKNTPPFPERDDIDVKAVMQPAREVGGDFYNYFLKDDLLYFVIADVSGKGVPAAIVMAIATELFLISAPDETDASKIVEKINRQISRDNGSAMFITMIVGILDIKAGKMQLCNAGHNPPYLIGTEDGKCAVNAPDLPKNVPVGLFDDFPYQTVMLPFCKGTRLVLYTDGVTEAENASKEQFGEARLRNILARNPADICAAVEESVHAFANGYEQSDDITVMCIETYPHCGMLS